MGVFSITAEIGNPSGQKFQPIELTVDTGSSVTTLPASMLQALGVQPIETQHFKLADGTVVEAGVGQTWIRLEGRPARITDVAFGEDDVPPLLGAITLEQFYLGVDSRNKRLVPEPGYRLTRLRIDE